MSPERGRSFQESLTRIRLRPITGVFFRAVPENAARYALEDGPSYLFNNRYNIANQFGALYFADRAEVCRATLEKRGLLPGRRIPYVLFSFDIQVDGIIDLTDAKVLEAMGVGREDLVRTREQSSAYDIPQALALAAYHGDRIRGLHVPDATETGNTLVLYPACLLARDFIRTGEQVAL